MKRLGFNIRDNARAMKYKMGKQLTYIPYLFMKKKTLIDKLDSEDYKVRENAARRLKGVGFNRLKTDEEERMKVKVKALLILGKLEDLFEEGKPAIPHLVEAFAYENRYLEWGARTVLDWMREENLPYMVEALGNENAKIRENAAAIIWGHAVHREELMTDKVMEAVEGIRCDEENTVRFLALNIMTAMETRRDLYSILMSDRDISRVDRAMMAEQ